MKPNASCPVVSVHKTHTALIQSAAERRTPKAVNRFLWTAALCAALDFPMFFSRLGGPPRPTYLVTRWANPPDES